MFVIRLRPGVLALALAVLAGLWLFAGWSSHQPPISLGAAALGQPAAGGSSGSAGPSGTSGGLLISGPLSRQGDDPSGGSKAAAGMAPGEDSARASGTGETQDYVVQPGDTLSGIARRFQVTVSTLVAANALADPDALKPGQTLRIPVHGEVTYVVKEGDTLWDIATRFGLAVDEMANLNDLPDVSSLSVGQTLRLPVARSSDPNPEKTQAALGTGTISDFSWPIVGRLTSPFGLRWGRMHTGIDIAGTTGQQIRAAKDGVVAAAGRMGGYGLAVKLDHPDGTSTLYAHSSKLLVKKGQRVSQGDVLALVGSTGHSTGPHLHFEVIVRNRSQDPLAYLPKR